MALHRGTLASQPPAVGDVPTPGLAHRGGPLPVAGDQGDGRFGQRQRHQLRHDPQEMERPVGLEHRVELVTALQRLQRDPRGSRRCAGRAPPRPDAAPDAAAAAPSSVPAGAASAWSAASCAATAPAPDATAPSDRSPPWAPPGATRVGQRALAARQHLPMTHARAGCHHHPCAAHLRPPAQVEVLAHDEDVGVKTAELREQVGAHERAAAGCEEHVADRVVLAVVDLPRFHPVDHGPALVDGHPHVQEARRVVPTDEFGRDDARVGTERFLYEDVDGVGIRGDVVVAEQQVGGALDHPDHAVRRSPRTPR